MKKFLCLILALAMLSTTMVVFAEKDVTVKLFGEVLEFDVKPQLINSRTMVPMRKIYESLGAKVEWVEEAQLILATYKTNIITMEIGKSEFSITDVVKGETKTILLDVPPQIVNSRTLVPVRAVSEALYKKVDWDNETFTVLITEL